MKQKPLSPLPALLCNIALLYVLYLLCRVVYVWEMWDVYAAGWGELNVGQLLWGGLRFDTAAICYTNIVWGVMVLLPIGERVRKSRCWHIVEKGLYVVVNTLALWLNLFDTVYSRYTGRRTTGSFATEFAGEGNLGSIFFTELGNHWYLVLIGIGFLAALILLYRPSKTKNKKQKTIILNLFALLLFLFLCVAGMRGGVSYHRPLSVADANGYVNHAKESNIVLNTPFSLIRTIGKTTFSNPHYFTDEELDRLYSPIHKPQASNHSPQKNVVILILESFGEEYWGYFNQGKGYTPFLDSLAAQSLTFRRSYANGRKSIDALPSILSSLPMFVEPFILTRYAGNEVGSIASCLGKVGYRTAFFHGADNQSMGFRSYALSVGFDDYFGMDEYCLDPRFGGKQDFDGYWAIWDEEFLQYFAHTLDTLPQPFMTTLFTATSHHPFNIPQRYERQFIGGSLPVYRTIQYTDFALQRFFATARTMPWYDSTIFVLTADHTNIGEREEYKSDLGLFRVPLLIYDPTGQLPRGVCNAVAQQIDILPTLLSIVGYPHPYLAFGIDLLSTPPQDTWAVNYTNGVYQMVSGDQLILFDGEKVTATYNLATDPCLKHPDRPTKHSPSQENLLKAVIQSYMQRMINNRLM